MYHLFKIWNFISDDPERPYNFKECETLDCFYVHCEECWFEIGEICLACNQLIIETDDVDFSDWTPKSKLIYLIV